MRQRAAGTQTEGQKDARSHGQVSQTERQVDGHMCGKLHRQWLNKQRDLRTDRWTTSPAGSRAGRAEVPLLVQAIHCRGVTS